jgi:long-chain fatty acid transport protein
VVFLAATLLTGSAAAQETPSTFEFSFSNPGARSLGLAGAFAALADDATTAFANPAGLVQLQRPEVSLEGRHWSYSTPYVQGGRVEGVPTGIGIDTTEGLRTAVSEEDLTALSYLSFVYPMGRWSLALYRHQLANFSAQTSTQGLFHTGGTEGQTNRSYDRRWSTELDISSYGLAGAYRISDRLSLGIGVVYFDGMLDALFEWYFPDDDTQQGIFGPNSYLSERLTAYGSMMIDDSDWGLSAGILWSFAERWSLGAFYRQGPEFRLVFDVRAGPVAQDIDPAYTPGATVVAIATPMEFPDVYGFGIAYRSRDGKLAVGFEWDRVEYSTIFGSFDPVVIETLDSDLDLGTELVADDGNEYRLGAEYAFIELEPVLALRAGVWLDPNHRFRSISDDPVHRALFQSGEDEVHVAVGAGVAFGSFQLDLAADFSDPVDTFSLSAIVSF